MRRARRARAGGTTCTQSLRNCARKPLALGVRPRSLRNTTPMAWLSAGLTSGRATRSALNAAGTAPPGTMAMPTPAHTHCMTVANWLTVTACRSGTAAIDA
ncbi:hypothetical protein G6F65_021311 [Rhizopus arrhizus]|nr:hypothetical protein G6F65_021311 [Rhizopus arrhizus]